LEKTNHQWIAMVSTCFNKGFEHMRMNSPSDCRVNVRRKGSGFGQLVSEIDYFLDAFQDSYDPPHTAMVELAGRSGSSCSIWTITGDGVITPRLSF
jgi:hypothetical protein